MNEEFHFDSYGESFSVDDILGCYLDFGDDDDENSSIRISFTKNGLDLGPAFEFQRKLFSDRERLIFYPHILVKNVKFQCNFGQLVSVNAFRSQKKFFHRHLDVSL